MSVVLIFLAVIAAIVGWWLSQQRLAAKPWLEEGVLGELPGTGALPLPAAKLGLGVFLVVASALFALLISAYSMRMHGSDWRPLPQTDLLWLNSGILLLSSAVLHLAKTAADRKQLHALRDALLAGGALALAFLVGQLFAWRELSAAGYYLQTNPANSFFYLLTALHGLHVLGGLVVLGVVTAGVWRAGDVGRARLSVELCAVYWHFLLAVWIILFATLLLTGTYSAWYDWLYSMCFGSAS